MDPLDDLSELVEELKNTKALTGIMSPPEIPPSTPAEVITEENIDEFIYRQSSTLIQQGIDTMSALKSTVLSGAVAETVEAYSKLMSSVAGSIEILNKINLQKRKEKAAKALKQMDLDNSRNMLEKYDGKTTINQTNIVVASREEIMKALLSKADSIIDTSTPAIDVDPE